LYLDFRLSTYTPDDFPFVSISCVVCFSKIRRFPGTFFFLDHPRPSPALFSPLRFSSVHAVPLLTESVLYFLPLYFGSFVGTSFSGIPCFWLLSPSFLCVIKFCSNSPLRFSLSHLPDHKNLRLSVFLFSPRLTSYPPHQSLFLGRFHIRRTSPPFFNPHCFRS